MAFYVTTRVRSSTSPTQRQAFAPRTMWLLGRPQIGRSMALIDDEGHSVITSRIQRILRGAANDAVYVQTHNSLYQLEQAQVTACDSIIPAAQRETSQSKTDDPPTGRDLPPRRGETPPNGSCEGPQR